MDKTYTVRITSQAEDQMQEIIHYIACIGSYRQLIRWKNSP